ncbi:uncharacterized protein BROUX77_006831 [Berkeleyomyces rouxiae]|uniref:uncharacterized protein n=1 Tax=Berkeleyomyces rouxiae TaxID=2035830 RepID=UPI003B7E085E
MARLNFLALLTSASLATAQTFQRKYFDLRLEVHAPLNGSEAFNNGAPDEGFTVTIGKVGSEPKSITELTYYDGETTVANWFVRPISTKRKAKNVVLLIGDGMTTNMITAARLLGHKFVNGKYQSHMTMDTFPVIGHQMTHSIDSYMTDSANSAASLFSGHKSTVDSMGVYSDSSPDLYDDPEVETIVELVTRLLGKRWGAVSTASLTDATPTALTAHTRTCVHYSPLLDRALNGLTNYTWIDHNGSEVYFGGGAEFFFPNKKSYKGKDYYAAFSDKGYSIANDNMTLGTLTADSRALGVFSTATMPVWLDRNIYTDDLAIVENHPSGKGGFALDVPGLKDITSKAIEIMTARSKDKGFFLMAEAASIDKQIHTLDCDRALGDLLELDDVVSRTIDQLKKLGIFEDTQIVVTADHGHGFDVFGSADTKYIAETENMRDKRKAIGTYGQSGESQYTKSIPGINYGTGPNFPMNWEPRYAIVAGAAAALDRRENYRVHSEGPRRPVKTCDGSKDYFVNDMDATDGFIINGTIPTVEYGGVHSLTDVPLFALGPCQNEFGGVYNNIEIFYKIAECLALGAARTDDGTIHTEHPSRHAADRS